MQSRPCPVCSAPDGFHDEGPHSAAREAIPARLRRPSNSAVRRERRAERDVTLADMGQTLRLDPAEQQRRFFDGADGRKLLADMAAALLTPDAPELDR